MPEETQRSTSGEDSTEEQKPSPDEYEHQGVGGGPEADPAGQEDADRSARQGEAAAPPRGDPGPPSDA